MLFFININLYNCTSDCIHSVLRVLYSVCSFVCCVSFYRGVILCDVCCLLCLIVLPLPPGKNQFAVKTNNNNKIIFRP
jgi:hypothetical protein